MNAKKKKLQRIYKKGLMNLNERQEFDREQREELMIKKQKSNKKIKRDINGDPTW